jgi:predicted permease
MSADPRAAPPKPSRAFRLLLRLLPFEFRSDFGDEMQEVFRDERHAASLGGRHGQARLWIRTVVGLLTTAARQHLDAMRQDVLYAIRTLRRTPALSLVAMVSLALGIGANTAIFGFLNTLFLRGPAQVAESGALVGIHGRSEGRILPARVTREEFEALRSATRTLTDVAAHTEAWVWMAGERRDPVELSAGVVSLNYFSLLGMRPALGRLFEASDGTSPPVAVLAHHVWQAQFGGDPAILGSRVSLNQRIFTIVGVAPEGFAGIYQGAQRSGLWIPPGTYDGWTAGEDFDLVGRLAPARTVDEAQAELGVLLRAPRAPATREGSRETDLSVTELRGVHPFDRANLVRIPLLLAGVVAFLLLIACANLAGLLLARSSSRRFEMAVRVSLGATRGRLVRQLLTESVLLSAAGALAATLVAIWANRLIETHFAYVFDRLRIGFDQRVLLFTFVTALASAIGFGLAPALEVSRVPPFGALRDGGDSRATRGSPLRTALLVGQVALSVALLVGALLMVRSLSRVVDQPGYAQDDVAHYRLRPSRNRYTPDRAAAYYQAIAARLQGVPGVRSVTFASNPPVRGWGGTVPVSRPDAATPRVVESIRNDVSPGFFRELGMPLARGREFEAHDRPGSPPVVVVTQSLAASLWGDQDPLGRPVTIEDATYTVVGVVRDVYAGRGTERPPAYVYFSHAQRRAVDARLFVRTSGDATAMVSVLRRELVAVDPLVHIGQEMTLRRRTALSFELERLTSRVLAGTGSVALALTALGLYGILSFWVGQRTREIGVRMSLGADARAILRLVVRQGMAPVAVGLLFGAVLALTSMRLLRTLLYGVSSQDPASLGGAALLVTGVAFAACCLPARRATRVDPVTALRAE